MPSNTRVVWGASLSPAEPVEGINERCIELPLALDVMALQRPGRVLDAGCALNGHLSEHMEASVFHLTQNVVSEKNYGHLTRPLSYVSADLRDLSVFADGAFDRTVCVSTLEHVGLNNATYLGSVETCPESMCDAVRELCRVTAHALLITVPFCDPPQGCEQWRFLGLRDLQQMARILFTHGFDAETRFYAKTDGGWYGGALDPVEANMEGFPESVNAIACLRGVQ